MSTELNSVSSNLEETSPNFIAPNASGEDRAPDLEQALTSPSDDGADAIHDDDPNSDALLASEPETTQLHHTSIPDTLAPSMTVPVERPVAVLPRKSGMVSKISLFIRLFNGWLYSRVVHEPSQVRDVLSIPNNECLVYLVNSENRLDFLYFNNLCITAGMPTAYVSNGSSKRHYGTLGSRIRAFFGRYNKNDNLDSIVQAIREHRPALIFLNQYGLKEREKQTFTENLLNHLIKLTQNEPGTKIHLVPVGIIWERRAKTYNHTILNDIYGTPTRPSSVRRFFAAVPGFFQLFFKIGQPQCLIHHEVLSKDSSYKSGAELRTALIDDIDQMHRQVNGPTVKPHQQLMREILDSEPFRNELRAIQQSTEQSEEELVGEAKQILEKTSSKFSFLMIKLLCTFLTPLFAFLYHGLYFDPEKLNEIRELSKTNRLIFIPSHKSHIDYLVLSVVMFQHGMIPPHIAAGENLNFFLIGSILRRGGAFFIKRTFKGEQLYTTCLKHYIGKILAEGYPIEFFIEGGRSRTGQVLPPKYGILRMIAQAVQSDMNRPVLIIPCAITYEKVIEDLAYKKEQEGGKKEKESIAGLIKTTKLLFSKYGQLYVSFAEPIDFNASIKPPSDMRPDQADETFTRQIDAMASELMQRINQVSTITTSSLFSAALLNQPVNAMPFSQLLSEAAFFLNLLIERGAQISPVLQTGLAANRATLRAITSDDARQTPSQQMPSQLESIANMLNEPMNETIKLFKKNGDVRQKGPKDAPTIEIAKDGRLQMSFYKNILLFAIIDDIYFALALSCTEEMNRSRETIAERFIDIQDLFKIEFNMIRPDQIFDESIRRFIARGWVNIDDNGFITIQNEGTIAIKTLTRCFTPHVQSYKIVFNALEKLEGSIAEPTLIEQIMTTTQSDIEAGTILPESRSQVMFSHAIQRLTALKCLSVSYDTDAKKAVKILKVEKDLPKFCLF